MRYIIGLSALLLATISFAQVYTWTDAEGKKHYSDQPPTGIVAKDAKIKTSKGVTSAPVAQESLAEKEAAFKQRRMDKEEAEKKEAEKAKEKQDKQAYCSSLKGHLAGLKQSTRLVEYDESGKKKILGTDAKQAEIAKTEKEIADNCK